mmetsp:Transcript_33786/g.85415  ORF Transcript_33786/g.85415 Transcript_33786/m.85415 type:complete len:665 (-) Transcript_33786:372-2366(-)
MTLLGLLSTSRIGGNTPPCCSAPSWPSDRATGGVSHPHMGERGCAAMDLANIRRNRNRVTAAATAHCCALSSPTATAGNKGSMSQQVMGEDELRMRLAKLEAENERLRERLTRERTGSMRNLANLIGDASPVSAPSSPMKGPLKQSIAIPEDPKSSWKALTIIVLGATGDLAKKKTFPALMALSRAGLLPPHASIVGYGRTKWSQDDFQKMLETNLKPCNEKAAFKRRCAYQWGQYDSPDDMGVLKCVCAKIEGETMPESEEFRMFGVCANRLFYFALPPFTYPGAAKAINKSAMSKTGWSRMVIEKPFGRDSESYLTLSHALSAEFSESQMYRIDHYLGKEIAQSIMTLRFANLVFEPLWNRNHVSCVHITFKEDIGTQGRGGYFDEYGMIRDVMQNHLIQLLALIAMETPISLGADDVRNRKVEVLRCIDPIRMQDVVVGQYVAAKGQEGYLDDKTVPAGSITPTYAMAALYINNSRWSGVPFILSCGKALSEKLVDIRVQFKPTSGNLFEGRDVFPNELVMRVQPDEAIFLRCMTKAPGLSADVAAVEMDLTYKKHFQGSLDLPDAYERLILDALNGDSSLFVRDDELAAAWRIFTPVLTTLDTEKVQPLPYEFGSPGPTKAQEMLTRLGFFEMVKGDGVSETEKKKVIQQMESFSLGDRA